MYMQLVDSSNIAAIGYDEEKKELYIEFKSNGVTYKYEKVPEEVYRAFMDAPSQGKFFHANIKGIYEFEKA